MPAYHSASGSMAENLFTRLFSETFGGRRPGTSTPNTTSMTSTRTAGTPTSCWKTRDAGWPDEGSHHKGLVASGKFYDDLLKQNSMVYLGWDVYRWAVRQM